MRAAAAGAPPVRQSTSAELEAFGELCMRLAGFEPRLMPHHVDGWLTALACGPVRLPADTWLALLCDDAFDRAFADPPDRTQALATLQARLDVLHSALDAEALLAAPDTLRLDPYLDDWQDEDRQRLADEEGVPAEEAAAMRAGVLWAEGVLSGLDALQAQWQLPEGDDTFDDDWQEMTSGIEALLLAPGSDDERAHFARRYEGKTPERDDVLTDACFALQDLRLFLLDHAPRPETRRVQPQPGRNHPCPCGSGKKYKKCHGAQG